MAITDSNQIIEKFMGANEQSLKEYFSSFLETRHRRPCLVVMTVGDDQRAKEAASRKVLLGGRVGVDVVVRSFPETVKMHDFRSDLRQMAKDRQVDGVYLQMPMPGRINVPLLTEEIAVAKDVGGYGALSDCYPCAPLAFLLLLSSLGIRLEGKNALIAGRGQAIAEPMSQMLLAKGCTVHVCHESTEEADLEDAARTGSSERGSRTSPALWRSTPARWKAEAATWPPGCPCSFRSTGGTSRTSASC